MAENIFLIDANAFLTPSKNYYRFSIAPSYWEQINHLANEGYIKTIDKVEREVCPRKDDDKKDELQIWYEDIFQGEVIKTKTQQIVDSYAEVINFLYASERYSEKAFLEWSTRDDVADPWLLATAKVFDYTIISFERPLNYNGGYPMSRAKIPNVCDDLNIKYTNLYNMMERLEVTL